MLDSWEESGQNSFLIRIVKKIFVSQFESALVSGSLTKQYLVSLGMDPNKIHLGYDVVDNSYFSSHSLISDGTQFPRSALPNEYFLSISRLVKKKNLPLVLKALSKFLHEYRLTSFNLEKNVHSPAFISNVHPSLVIVGNGPLLIELKDLCVSLKLSFYANLLCHALPSNFDVVFYPFQQYQTLPFFYSNAISSVLASNCEEWGLVVNESMACSTPVICSNGVGSAHDLIIDGLNGYIFLRNSLDDLAQCFRESYSRRFEENIRLSAFCSVCDWDLNLFANSAFKCIVSLIK
jgi:glycosyltransferase involved in cell wall biosynthesis